MSFADDKESAYTLDRNKLIYILSRAAAISIIVLAREMMDGQLVANVLRGLKRFAAGIPRKEFKKVASGEKRNKL